MKTPHYNRYQIIASFLGLMCLLIIVQVLRIQNSDAATVIMTDAKYREGRMKTLIPSRGEIYDRYGHLLAGNEQVYELGVNLAVEDLDVETIASVVSQITGADYSFVRSQASLKWSPTNQYAVLANFVTADQIAELQKRMKDFNNAVSGRRASVKDQPSLRGLDWQPFLKRSYPEGSLASNLLGFYSYLDPKSGHGYFGVEEKYNDLLAGSPQQVYVPYDPILAQQLPEVKPGASLVLTIDRAIQAAVEVQLDQALASSGAEAGTIIVADPKTGEILAMASTPRIDLNEYWKNTQVYPNATMFNRAVSTTYEPGSVFKVLTMAAALDAGAVKPDTTFLDQGVYEIGGSYIYNWDGGAWGYQDMTGCMQHSLNVCLAWVASELGSTRFYDYLQSFGIGHQTGIDLAGEAYYPLRLPGDNNWYPVDLGTNAFGQGLAVTPIQMVMAISSVANDGKMMTPHLLKAMVNNGRQYNTSLQVAKSPISADTARTLTAMLARSLEEESSNALVPGYRVAGKTGTAEIPTPAGYSMAVTNASFVGWGPIDDPRFLVYVWLEKPTASKWGSVVAAPVFRDVVKNLVVLMDIPPDDIRQKLNAQ